MLSTKELLFIVLATRCVVYISYVVYHEEGQDVVVDFCIAKGRSNIKGGIVSDITDLRYFYAVD